MSRKKKKVDKKADISLYDKQVDVLRNRFGDAAIQFLDNLESKETLAYSTGSLGLDYIISANAGGMPGGYILELYGNFSTGKTTLAMGLCANVTANGKNVIFIDAERSLKSDLPVNAGINKKLFTSVHRNDANIGMAVIKDLLRTGEVGAVVIDSVTAWKPPESLNSKTDLKDYGNPQLGRHAKFITNALADLSDLCADTGCILVLLNQIRANTSGYGRPDQPAGGYAQAHYDTVRIRLSGSVQSSKKCIRRAGEDKVIGQKVTCYCDKNKYDMPLKTTEVPLILGIGVDPYMELADLATSKTNVLTNVAGYYKWADTGENIVRGADEFSQLLYNDYDLYKELESKVIDALGIKYNSNLVRINPYIAADGTKRHIYI